MGRDVGEGAADATSRDAGYGGVGSGFGGGRDGGDSFAGAGIGLGGVGRSSDIMRGISGALSAGFETVFGPLDRALGALGAISKADRGYQQSKQGGWHSQSDIAAMSMQDKRALGFAPEHWSGATTPELQGYYDYIAKTQGLPAAQDIPMEQARAELPAYEAMSPAQVAAESEQQRLGELAPSMDQIMARNKTIGLQAMQNYDDLSDDEKVDALSTAVRGGVVSTAKAAELAGELGAEMSPESIEHASKLGAFREALTGVKAGSLEATGKRVKVDPLGAAYNVFKSTLNPFGLIAGGSLASGVVPGIAGKIAGGVLTGIGRSGLAPSLPGVDMGTLATLGKATYKQDPAELAGLFGGPLGSAYKEAARIHAAKEALGLVAPGATSAPIMPSDTVGDGMLADRDIMKLYRRIV